MKTVLQEVKPIVEEVFDHLHAHPEISWKEIETTKYLQQLTENEGYEVTTFEDSTGLVVTTGAGGHCVGLRRILTHSGKKWMACTRRIIHVGMMRI